MFRLTLRIVPKRLMQIPVHSTAVPKRCHAFVLKSILLYECRCIVAGGGGESFQKSIKSLLITSLTCKGAQAASRGRYLVMACPQIGKVTKTSHRR